MCARLFRVLMFMLVPVVTAVTVTTVGADGCYRSRYYYPSYSQSYYYPKQTYTYSDYKPYVAPVEVTKDYYFSVSDYYRDKLLVDAIVGRMQAMGVSANVMGIPGVSNNTQGYSPPGYTQSNYTQGQSVPQQVVPAQQRNLTPKTATQVSANLIKIVADKCYRCHNTGRADGGLVLMNEQKQLLDIPEGQKWKAHGYVYAGVMPKGAEPLTDAEAKLFYDWANDTVVQPAPTQATPTTTPTTALGASN